MYVAPPENRKVIQMAYLVNDLEASAHKYMKTLGIGPFYIVNRPKIADETYRGAKANVEFSTAITQAGGIQIELVQQHCSSPSCYRDIFQQEQEGFHHIAVFAEDYDAELARYAERGIQVASAGRMGPMRFSYVDTFKEIGAMTEVLEDVSFIRSYFENLSTACEGWDGSRPIRETSELF